MIEPIHPEDHPFTDLDLNGLSEHRNQSHRDSWKRIKAEGPVTQYSIRNRMILIMRKFIRWLSW